MIEDDAEDNSTQVNSAHVRDYFETDFFLRDNYFNKSLATVFEFQLTFTNNETGAEQKIIIARKLNFDFEANALYSYFFINEVQPPELMVLVCRQLIHMFVQNPLSTAPPGLLDEINLRKNESDRFHSSKRLIDTRYMVIYCGMDLSETQKREVYYDGDSKGMVVKVRDRTYVKAQLEKEKPLAFISHDSRDKDGIARPLAQELTRILGRVWFDDFSLRPGANLRESIEQGLKECKRCVLVLTPNFLSNSGWGKTEFDSVFTREILERKNVVIPVWAGVSPKEVYEYSPSLANKVAVMWDEGCEVVASKIRDVIIFEV